ncbi:MerR family transcriptional regulator [Chitinimonas naiadis]
MSDLPIAATEMETRVPRELLRMWERRYGFPAPRRDEHGDRLYSPEEVEKLKLIRYLIDRGFRPRQLMPMNLADLSLLQQQGQPKTGSVTHEEQDALCSILRSHDVAALHAWLRAALCDYGLQYLLIEHLPGAIRQVEAARQDGSLAMHEAHFFKAQVQFVLQQALQAYRFVPQPPRILLTHLSGDQDAAALAITDMLLRTAGCEVLAFGDMTAAALIQASVDYEIDIVVFALGDPHLRQGNRLLALREQMRGHTLIWVTGQALTDPLPAGMTNQPGYAQLLDSVRGWRSGSTRLQGLLSGQGQALGPK